MELFKTLSKYVSLFLGALSLVAASIAAELPSKPTLTLDIARSTVAAAGKKAAGNHLGMVIPVPDDSGNLLFLERMDDAPLLDVIPFEEGIALTLNRRSLGAAEAPSRTVKRRMPALLGSPQT